MIAPKKYKGRYLGTHDQGIITTASREIVMAWAKLVRHGHVTVRDRHLDETILDIEKGRRR